MRKPLIALAGFGIVAAGLMSAPAAQAANPAPAVPGWTNGTVTCSNGAVSVFPMVITNTTSQTRTGSYTVGEGINLSVQFASAPQWINCNGATTVVESQNFTVGPGQTIVQWVGVGTGSNSRQGTGSHNIAFGGLPSGTRGQSWYDLNLSSVGQSATNGGAGFSSLQVQYDGTGGTDTATNGQDLFNIVPCTSTSAGIFPASGILTPYSSGWTTGPTYSANQAICAAWLPTGTFQSFTTGFNADFQIQAAQVYNSAINNNDQPLAIAGAGSVPITSLTLTWSGASGGTNPGTTPGQNAWYAQDPVTSQWVVVNIVPTTAPTGPMTVTVNINGVAVGTVNYNPGYNPGYNPSFIYG